MTEKYFSKFPTFVYRDKVARDITRRVTINPMDKNNPYNFYPFLLRDDLRSDQVADFYHRDPELDWLVYHVNKVIDPYYDWHNSNEVFQAMLIQKYGSVESSMEKIYLYQNNWATDDSQYTPSQYDNQLPNAWKKYYTPVWGPKAEIIAYERKKEDFYQNTNRILKYTVSYNTDNEFSLEELIDIKYNGEIVGGGEVEYANSSTVSIKHVSGNTIANSSVVVTLIGETSAANATSNAVTTLVESIPLDEDNFWSPVYYYEFELSKNEAKKHINLINDDLAQLVINQFEKKLQI